MKTSILFFRVAIKGLLLCCVVGCYKNHLYVQQEWVDVNFLASSHVGTPDPRQEDPPEGQRLLIGWNFPRCMVEEGLVLWITVRLWDNTQDFIVHLVDRKRGSAAFYYPNKDDCIDRRILTYKVEVLTSSGFLIETWKHHFWTELIEMNR